MNARIRVTNIINKKNQIKEREELLNLLKNYKTILNKPIYDYMSALIELDVSVIKDYISDDERSILAELEIYNEAARYNIYNRTIKLFKQEEAKIGKVNIEDINGILSIKEANSNTKIFEFNHIKNMFGDTVDDEKIKNIGNIFMFKTELASTLNSQDIVLINQKLAKVESIINPYGSYAHHGVNRGLSYTWEQKHKQEINEYKYFLKTVNIVKNLTPKQKKEIGEKY